jgi:hypothetical protein
MKDVPDAPPPITPDTDPETQPGTMAERFMAERVQWTAKIKELGGKMKHIVDMSELMTNIYTERQIAVEYHYYLLGLLSKVNKSYRKQYAEKYDYYTYKSQKRFPNERNKEIQIMSELAPTLTTKESLENHSKFMEDTIKTVDQIIFGIKARVEIENMLRGK